MSKGKLKNGKFIDEKIVLELKAKDLSARAIAKVLDCSITPVPKIIKNHSMFFRNSLAVHQYFLRQLNL